MMIGVGLWKSGLNRIVNLGHYFEHSPNECVTDRSHLKLDWLVSDKIPLLLRDHRRVIVPLALVVCASLVSCGPSDREVPSQDAVYENWAPEAEYVGKEACRECHWQNYDSFVQSQMGRSWRNAALSLSNADFNNPDPVYAPDQNLYYQPFHVGEDLFVREYRIVDGDTIHNRVEQIDYIVGSGQHTNSHIYSVNGYLYQIPVTWYAQEGHWDLAPGFAENNSRFDRLIPEACMTCHNGRSPVVPGSENRYTAVAEGIACERCHGPGSIHIEETKAGRVVDINVQIDYTIVNPAKLAPERQLDLCARCHMQAADVFRAGVQPDDFRPGRRLSDFENVYWPRQPDSVHVFNMASHPDRMAMSECFRESWSEDRNLKPMTCLTCHDPHVAIETITEQFYTDVCQSCHETSAVPACSEPSVIRGTAKESCATCHMPNSGTLDIPHIQITDHFIRVTERDRPRLSEEEFEEQTRFIRMASLIDPNPSDLDLALGFMSYFEKITNRPEMLEQASKALQRARKVETEQNLESAYMRLWYLQGNFSAIRRALREHPDYSTQDAWTNMRIGEAFAVQGSFLSAMQYLELAVKAAPEHLRFMTVLASIYSELGTIDQALTLYDRILEANPKHETAVNNRGYANLMSGNFVSAEIDFKRAIELNPDAEMALANLASLYLNTNRQAMAIPLAQRLLSLDPENPQYLLLWKALNP